MATEQNIRPRVKEAGELFLSMPEGERSYAAVAKRMFKTDGGNITEPRAAVYVREYLEATGQTDLAPRRGRRTNGGAYVENTFTKQVEDAIEQFNHRIDLIETDLVEAQEAVSAFDEDAFKTKVAEEMRERIAEITARLTAWEADEGGVATDSATDTLEDLQRRADTLENAAGERLENLQKERTKAEAALNMLIEMQEAMDAAASEGNTETGNTEI